MKLTLWNNLLTYVRRKKAIERELDHEGIVAYINNRNEEAMKNPQPRTGMAFLKRIETTPSSISEKPSDLKQEPENTFHNTP